MPEPTPLYNRLLLSQEAWCRLPVSTLKLPMPPPLAHLIEDIDERMIEGTIRGMFLSGWLRGPR